MSYDVIKTCGKCGQPLLIELEGQRLGCTCDCYDAKVARSCAAIIAKRDEDLAFYRETPAQSVAEHMAGVFQSSTGAGFVSWAQQSPYGGPWWAVLCGKGTYDQLASGALRLSTIGGKGVCRCVPVSSASGMRSK